MKKHVKFEYDKITPLIYLGANTCCLLHFKEELLRKGIRADISLERERIDNPQGVDCFLWLPTTDTYAPSQKQLYIATKTIDAMVKQKIKMYIHCKNAHGRAPTALAAYFITQGMKVKEAIDFIKLKRPEIHPNSRQIKALKKFKKMFPKYE